MHVHEVTKARICTKVEEGWSMRRVADEFRISKSSVSRICKKWREERNLSRTPGSGRPRISNAQEDDGLITYINRNPFDTAKNAIRNTGFPGSAKTGLRRLRHAGLYSYMAVNKTFLTPAWKEQRMGFVLHHLARNIWDKVIFSDEKIFQSSYNGKIRVFRPPSMRFQERYVNKVRRNPRYSVNVWGWLSVRGLGILHNIENRLNSEVYINILENVMVPSVRRLYPDNDYIFLQDNCPVHKSQQTTQWLNANGISVLDFPTYSGDLNVIENVWGLMVRNIARQNVYVQSREELLQVVQAAWAEIPVNCVTNLVNSMPRRLNKVIEAQGTITKY